MRIRQMGVAEIILIGLINSLNMKNEVIKYVNHLFLWRFSDSESGAGYELQKFLRYLDDNLPPSHGIQIDWREEQRIEAFELRSVKSLLLTALLLLETKGLLSIDTLLKNHLKRTNFQGKSDVEMRLRKIKKLL